MGTDYLEQDVVATRDDQLVVLHDIHLDRVTDVANRFPQRVRDDGRFYVRDLTLAEIKTLKVHERTDEGGQPVYAGRHKDDGSVHRVNTFAEELSFIQKMNDSVGRIVGIYPEIKKPAWHQQEGVDITALFLQTLQDFDYTNYSDPVYVQCFDANELIRIRNNLQCDLKLVQLIGDNEWREATTDYDALRTERGLQEIAEVVDAIGPWVNYLCETDSRGRIVASGLVSMAHDVGLAVHPYTFRSDELPPGFDSFTELLRFAIDKLNVDGLFTDFPDKVIAACQNNLF